MELCDWQEENRNYPHKILYNIGNGCGFFSEYNHLLLALHYCLDEKICFNLSSKYASFSCENGWSDYFEPFCEEKDYFVPNPFNGRTRYIPIRKKESLFNILFGFWRAVHGYDYLTYDIFDKIHHLSSDRFLIERCREIDKMIWRFNNKTKVAVNDILNNNQELDERFVSVHIRRGDKTTEVANTDINLYMSKLYQSTSVRRCFVATDDFSVYKQLVDEYKDWRFFTITTESQIGYNQLLFNNESKEQKKKDMYNLFATIEILAKSDLFVGTLSSNIGMYMYLRMPNGRCVGVDYNEWKIW